MARTAAQKLLESHLVDGKLEPGSEIALRIDQTLTQDATGTLVMLELEAMAIDRVLTVPRNFPGRSGTRHEGGDALMKEISLYRDREHLLGDIAHDNGKHVVHVHCVVGLRDGTSGSR